MGGVLLVEDRDDVREALEEAIRDGGYQVDVAKTLSEAGRAFARGAYDLVVADVRLPDGSGRDLAVKAAKLGKKAILITGHRNEMDESETDITYLQKPFLMKTLIDTIGRGYAAMKRRPAAQPIH